MKKVRTNTVDALRYINGESIVLAQKFFDFLPHIVVHCQRHTVVTIDEKDT